MGHYTRYTLKTEPEDVHDTIALRCTELGYPTPPGAQVPHSVFDYENWNGGDGPKWYSHDKDCQQVSQEFPNVLIEVTGVPADDDDDPWIARYKDGRRLEWQTVSSDRDAQTLCEIDDDLLRRLAQQELSSSASAICTVVSTIPIGDPAQRELTMNVTRFRCPQPGNT